jgi:hypothetical protein
MGEGMNSVALLIVIAVGLGTLILAWWMNKEQTELRKQQSEEWERERLSDENVLKKKADFERRLDENIDLPDGIRGHSAYIYRHLMSKWFDSLIAKYRYDEFMSRKIRSDWLSYMYSLESASTSGFLSVEAADADRRDKHEELFSLKRKQYRAIEDAFAAAIGNEAIEELQRVRGAPSDAFDRSGKKSMASTGYRYVLVSLHPYVEDLKPK